MPIQMIWLYWSHWVGSLLHNLFKRECKADAQMSVRRVSDALHYADAGKPIAWCKADIADFTACLRYYAG